MLLIGGIALIVTAMASTATSLEAASDGLLLIGWPLFIVGGVLKSLDWMSSYNAKAEGSWDHHVTRTPGRTEDELPAGRRRGRRFRLFRRRDPVSEYPASGPGLSMAAPDSVPEWTAPRMPPPPPAAPPAAAAPADFASAAAEPVSRPGRPQPAFDLEEDEPSRYRGRVDPGPDTVIEEFVGYEGQDRMLAVREAAPPPPPPPSPPPRELAWPNPPRQAVDTSPSGNDAFLGKLMDDVISRIGAGGTVSPAPAPAAEPAPAPAVAPIVWTRQALHSADHWRFAALVEKLYQQAGFATQLQAGQTMRGVVVLWLFSRHRPGMPASVVSCVHTPGMLLVPEEIVAVAELVKARGLPRGQLATTADVGEEGQKLAAARSVHLMDTERLLQLITQRTPEQQRVLADRLT